MGVAKTLHRVAFAFIALLLSMCQQANAFINVDKQMPDSFEISLITCSPGSLIYELYGHSAIRVQNISTGEDLAYNYGMFDFNTPHFVWRFVKGECDYHLAAYNFPQFLQDYVERGSSVTEQRLSLTSEEKRRINASLSKQAAKRGWTYRYNFFYDNCTTRVRDQIERCLVNENIAYKPTQQGKKSFRSIIHEFNAGHKWDQFGEDLLLGSGADKNITQREQMFSPIYMMHFADSAKIISADGKQRMLVSDKFVYTPIETLANSGGLPISPLALSIVLLLAVSAIAYKEYKTRQIFWSVDAVLMLSQGIAGSIILFMMLFSQHPTVDSNWLIWPTMGPLPLIWAIPHCILIYNKKTDYYAAFTAIVEGTFIISFAFLPQKFDAAIIVMALILLIQSTTSLVVQNKRNHSK